MTKLMGTKKKILDVSLALFAQKGYKSATMREIGREVGIQQSAIYNHFKNKEEILDTIIEELKSSDMINLFGTSLPQEQYTKGKAVLKKVSGMFKLMSYDNRHDLLFRFMMQELFVNDKISHFYNEEFYQKSVKRLSSIFFLMMQDEMIEATDPLLLASEFFAPLFFYQLQIVRLKADNKSTSVAATLFEKHTDFFWDKIKARDLPNGNHF